MQALAFEFEDEKELREAVDHLWKRLGVTGEINIRHLSGVWRLELVAEKPLRPNTLDKFQARRVE